MPQFRFVIPIVLFLTGAALLHSTVPDTAWAKKQSDEVDYLELAARLMADGNYERATVALRSVDAGDEKLDQSRYHTVSGLVALRTDRFLEAIEAFQKALEAQAKRENADPASDEKVAAERLLARQRVHLYLGQAYMRTADYARAIKMFSETGDVGGAIPMVYALKAQAYWELESQEKAFAALDEGAEKFPADHRFLRRKVFYMIDLGFYQRAAELGNEYLAVAAPGPVDYLAIGSALRKSRQPAKALSILERARLLYPENRDVSVELTHTYLDGDALAAAADILSQAANHHPDLLVEAAELQRRAGRLHRSLLLNSAVNDQPKKYRQRLSIFVAMERWELAAAMGDALRRTSLLADDDIRYAYAYALFKAGRYDTADEILGGISEGELFRKAAALRKTMETCRSERWKCL